MHEVLGKIEGTGLFSIKMRSQEDFLLLLYSS